MTAWLTGLIWFSMWDNVFCHEQRQQGVVRLCLWSQLIMSIVEKKKKSKKKTINTVPLLIRSKQSDKNYRPRSLCNSDLYDIWELKLQCLLLYMVFVFVFYLTPIFSLNSVFYSYFFFLITFSHTSLLPCQIWISPIWGINEGTPYSQSKIFIP